MLLGLFIILCFLAICYGIGRMFLKGIHFIFGKKKKIDMNNPYIQSHLIRRANDKAYEDYIEWLDKNGGDLPIDKIKTKEELKFEKELNI